MNVRIQQFAEQCQIETYGVNGELLASDFDAEKFAQLIVEETLKQVDEQVYGRGENSWYYSDDKKWVRLHFGYGELK